MRKIIQALVLAFPNLQNPLELEIYASGYAMWVILMQEGRPICYHFEMFHGGVLNYPNYDKELYALVQYVKKWKYYLMENDTIIHIDHQPL